MRNVGEKEKHGSQSVLVQAGGGLDVVTVRATWTDAKIQFHYGRLRPLGLQVET